MCHQNEQSKATRIFLMFYKLIHITFVIDFGFLQFKSAKIRGMYKAAALFQAVALSFYIIYNFHLTPGMVALFWYSLNVYRYMVYATFLLFRQNDINFYNFIRDLKTIDECLGVDAAFYSYEKKILAFVLTLFVYNSVLILASYYYLKAAVLSALLHTVVYILMTVCVDYVCMTNMFFYYAALCRLNKLYEILKLVNSDFQSFQLVYKLIVEVVEKYKPAFDFVFLTTLLYSVVQVMSPVYMLLCDIMNGNLSPFSLIIDFNEVAITVLLLLTFGTPISAGMLTTKANAIKILLLDKEMEHRDGPECCELARFIKYIEARGCQYRVFKVVPLNADLLGMVLSFCATYLIVIIQFTRPN